MKQAGRTLQVKGLKKNNKTLAGLIIIPLFIGLVIGCSSFVERPQFNFRDDAPHPVAVEYLPKTQKGYVDWVVAMDNSVIDPAESITSDIPKSKPLDLDIIFKTKEEYPVPNVIFPHRPHTAWLGCNNCHPNPFRMKAGGNPVTMARILKGEFCGKCHGRVAFEISDCFRCHSKKKEKIG